jgi:hypothetical protein
VAVAQGSEAEGNTGWAGTAEDKNAFGHCARGQDFNRLNTLKIETKSGIWVAE